MMKIKLLLCICLVLFVSHIVDAQADSILIGRHIELIKGEVSNGQKIGIWKRFFKGMSPGEILFTNDDSNRVILFDYEMPNVIRQNTEGYITGNKFIPHGRSVSFTSIGDTFSIGFYWHGLQNGEWITNFGNKNLQFIENYKNGMLNGSYSSYFKNGNLKAKGQYKDNLQVGVWQYYYENGNLREKGRHLPKCKMIQLEKDEIYEYMQYFDFDNPFNPLTRLTMFCIKSGIWKTYNEEGILKRIDYFKDGLLVDYKFIE